MTSSTTDAVLATARRVITREAEALACWRRSRQFGGRGGRGDPWREGRVIVSGMGKSGHIARKIAATFASTGTPAQFVHPAEASHGDLGMVMRGDVVMVLSNSGRNAGTGRYRRPHPPLRHPADRRSPPARIRHCCASRTWPSCCPTRRKPATPAWCLRPPPPWRWPLAMRIAVALMEHRQFTPDQFRVFHPGGKLGARLTRVADLMHTDMPLVSTGTPMSEALAGHQPEGLRRGWRDRCRMVT